MPFVDGESLRQRLTRDKQLPIVAAVRIATEVASALDYAHRHGVIHRDIKPGEHPAARRPALVADFGIALAASTGGTRMTETGMSLGTPHYMSPEQAMGERELDARSDIYALGCVLYEMLTGEPPFTGVGAGDCGQVITEKPVPPSRLRREIPAHVEDAVLTALQKRARRSVCHSGGIAGSDRGPVRSSKEPWQSQARSNVGRGSRRCRRCGRTRRSRGAPVAKPASHRSASSARHRCKATRCGSPGLRHAAQPQELRNGDHAVLPGD